VRKEFPEIEMSVQLGGLMTSALNMGLMAPIDIQIEGPDHKESYHIALTLAEKIRKLKGAVDVRVQQLFDDPIIYLDINRDKAMDLGIFTDEIVKNVDAAVSGSSTFATNNLWVDPNTGIDYFLAVQFPQQLVSNFEQFANIPIKGYERQRVLPLGEIANITKKIGWTEINHVNFRPVIDIYLDAQDRDIGGLSKDVFKVISQHDVPVNYTVDIRGEIAEMKNSVQSLGGGFLLAAVLVYLVLVVQFKSFILPLVIMVSVPLGLVGIVFMLLLTDTYFSIQAAIGAIFMIGIAVANGVLLIEFIIHQKKQIGFLNRGIIAGAKLRLRPILMTSFAAILGLVPMAIGIGYGSEANIPLGRAVIGGQLLSMLLTLFVVPVLYRTVVGKNHKKSRKHKS
jgi:multidrug efflux pump subunit AcrB